MSRRALLPALLAVSSFLAWSGCDCGERHASGDRHPAKTAEPAEPADEPADEPPPPSRAKEHTPAPTDPRFGTASVTFKKVDGQPHAALRVVIPEGAEVREGQTQPAAIYFDQGPPIAAPLTARSGAWQSADLRLPSAIESAARAIVKIPTRPQISFVFEVAGAWQSAATGPVTLEAGR